MEERGTEEIAGRLPIGDQLVLLEAIKRVTYPGRLVTCLKLARGRHRRLLAEQLSMARLAAHGEQNQLKKTLGELYRDG